MSDAPIVGGFRKVNVRDIEEFAWSGAAGSGFGKQISEALGREPTSSDLTRRHPFDVEVLRIAPGAVPYPYHSHSAQWEYYQVIAGNGAVRHDAGRTPIEAGDAFLFKPGEAHQLINDGASDLIVFVVADNPLHETTDFPDGEMRGAVG